MRVLKEASSKVEKCPRCGKSCIHCLKEELIHPDLSSRRLKRKHPDHHECWSYHRWTTPDPELVIILKAMNGEFIFARSNDIEESCGYCEERGSCGGIKELGECIHLFQDLVFREKRTFYESELEKEDPK